MIDKERILKKIYIDLKNSGSLSSIRKLYIEGKKIDDSININDVKYFLQGEDSYTLHVQPNKRFSRRPFLYVKPGLTILADCCYLKEYGSTNSPYLLFLLDGFSRYLQILPLNSLKFKDVKPAFESFFSKSIYNYSYIFTDRGTEFTSNNIQKYFKTLNLHWYSTFSSDTKVSQIERVIKTMKIKITRSISLKKSEKYLPHINDLVNCYNYSNHARLLFRSPFEVHLMSIRSQYFEFAKQVYDSYARKLKPVLKRLSLDTVVRLSTPRKVFGRSYHEKTTRELFKIDAINTHHTPITYKLKDLNGDDILGIFYHRELIPVRDSGIYDITIIKQKRFKGETMYLVKYNNYPTSKPEWIPKKNLI